MDIKRNGINKPTSEEWRDKAKSLINTMYDLGHQWDFDYNKCGQVYIYENKINEFINIEMNMLSKFLSENGWTNIMSDKKGIRATDGDDYIELKKRTKFYNPTNEDDLEYIVNNGLELIIHIEKEMAKFDIEVKSDFKMVENWKTDNNDELKHRYGYGLKAEEWKEECENIKNIMEKNQQIIDSDSFNFKLIYNKDRYDRDEEEKNIDSVVDILNTLQ